MTIWMSAVPTKCETCDEPITTMFYDEKTQMGPWGCICPTCHTLGPGIGKLGTGFGQEYTKTEVDGKTVWKKTAG